MGAWCEPGAGTGCSQPLVAVVGSNISTGTCPGAGTSTISSTCTSCWYIRNQRRFNISTGNQNRKGHAVSVPASVPAVSESEQCVSRAAVRAAVRPTAGSCHPDHPADSSALQPVQPICGRTVMGCWLFYRYKSVVAKPNVQPRPHGVAAATQKSQPSEALSLAQAHECCKLQNTKWRVLLMLPLPAPATEAAFRIHTDGALRTSRGITLRDNHAR